MTRLPKFAAAAILFSFFSLSAQAQQPSSAPIYIRSLTGQGTDITYHMREGKATGTNGVFIDYNGSALTADSVSVDENSGDAIADGNVRIQQGDQIYLGDHILYNFHTRQMVSDHFRSGKAPVYMEGKGLHGNVASNHVQHSTYVSTNAIITTDDVKKPAIEIHATRMLIIPNVKLEAWNAVLYAEGVPLFYLPYYERNLGPHANNFDFVPGYRSSFGPFVLGTYTWYLNDELNGKFHIDYRQRRGVGVGPDFDYHLGKWGEGELSYYYTHDDDAKTNFVNAPVSENRQRLYFTYIANPYTNVEVRAAARWQSDAAVNRDFFEGDYRQNPQPSTFLEGDKLFPNFSLDVLAQPRVDNFLETVERLPDVRLTGFQQELGATPVYYNSQSTLGYYRRLFAETNGFLSDANNFSAARADTYHQLTLPETLFGWLNIIPRVGGRYTYYTEAGGPNGTTEENSRAVFNTGAEVTFKASSSTRRSA